MAEHGVFAHGIAVSLPGSHVARLPLSGSVFGYEELRDAALPPDLRVAIALVMEAAATRGVPARFVARPEVFTHGVLAERLAARIGAARDHVALCDGAAFRPLAGLRNHLFFYRRGVPQACRSLRRLVEVAPEMFGALASQVNGALAFRVDGAWHRPPATLFSFAETPRTDQATLLPLVCHPADPDGSAAAALNDAAEGEAGDGPLRYVPLTEGMLADEGFMRVLADRLLSATIREEPLLVLQLPPIASGAGDIASQIAAVIRALAGTSVTFPRNAAVSARWATGPLGADRLAGASIVAHPGLDFWRIGRDAWQAAAEVELVQHGPAAAGFARLFRGWLGNGVPVRRMRRPSRGVTVGSVL